MRQAALPWRTAQTENRALLSSNRSVLPVADSGASAARVPEHSQRL